MYLYPVWVRLWHTLNAVLIIILIITGISMQFTGEDMKFLVGFEKAVRWHNLSATILTLSFIFFVTGNLVT